MTRVIGSCMNSSPYLLMAPADVRGVSDLRGKTLACRSIIAETAPLAATLLDRGRLDPGADLRLDAVDTDQHALDRLTAGTAGAALLPRPFDFVARERGFLPVPDWPEVAADPLPITLETTEAGAAGEGRRPGSVPGSPPGKGSATSRGIAAKPWDARTGVRVCG